MQPVLIDNIYSSENALAFLVNAYESKADYFHNHQILFYNWFLAVMDQDLTNEDFDLGVDNLSKLQEAYFPDESEFLRLIETIKKEFQINVGAQANQKQAPLLNVKNLALAVLVYSAEFGPKSHYTQKQSDKSLPSINFIQKLKSKIEERQKNDIISLVPLNFKNQKSYADRVASIGSNSEIDTGKAKISCFQIRDFYLKNIGLSMSIGQSLLMELSLVMGVSPFISNLVKFLYELSPSGELVSQYLGLSHDEYESILRGDEGITVFLNKENQQVLPMHSFWISWFAGGETQDMDQTPVGVFIKPINSLKNQSNNVNALGQIDEESEEVVKMLLAQAYDQNSSSQLNWNDNQNDVKEGHLNSTHVLLYGSSILNKIDVAKKLGAQVDAETFILNPTVPSELVRDALYVALRIISNLKNRSLLIIPKAQDILTRNVETSMMFQLFSMKLEKDVQETLMDQEILNSLTPCIWIVNDPSSINENSLGRFVFSCEVRPLSREARILEIKELLEPMGVRDSFIQEIGTYININENLIRSAISFTERTMDRQQMFAVEFVEARESRLRRAIKQGQRLLGRGQKENLRTSPTTYNLEYLNLKTRHPTEDIIQALKRHEKGSLCFYGIPGTGKTMLAEQISVMLNKPLMVKRASDILGKYVGESEKAIAQMFTDAAESESILLLDEADSFLRDRQFAKNAWEISVVNELLQAMERFDGIFICTTNLFAHLDKASLRRFTFKIEFKELNNEQRWKMFVQELNIKESEVSAKKLEDWKTELNNIKMLAPGDFATIQRQNLLFDKKQSPDQFLLALSEESKHKMLDHGFTTLNRPDTE